MIISGYKAQSPRSVKEEPGSCESDVSDFQQFFGCLLRGTLLYFKIASLEFSYY